MHNEAQRFVGKTVGPLDLSTKRVLDIGSYDINGSPRAIFAASPAYVGIDRREGPGVDVVTEAKDYQPEAKEAFDIAVSCETLEHADDPADVIACAWRALKEGGLLIITAAGPDREPHDVDGQPLGTGRAYTAIDRKLLGKLLADWEDVTIEYGASHGVAKGDIYATATKPAVAKTVKREAKAETAKDEGEKGE